MSNEMISSPLVGSDGSGFAHQHRVLIYTTCYNVLDGVTLTIRKLEQEILAAGMHVFILSTASGDPKNTNMDGTHPNRQVCFIDDAVPIPFLHDEDNPELTYHVGFALSPMVRARLDAFEPTIVHTTVQDCTGCHLIQYARDKELPIMGTYHSNIPEYLEHYPGLSWFKIFLGSYFRHQYNFLQALYVPTPYIRGFLCDMFHMDSITNVGIWGRGVDVNAFNPSNRSLKYRRTLGVADDTPIVCWVGRLVSEKRPDIFASVVRRLHDEGVNFHALVIGAGAGEEEIKALPNTTFAGWMTPAQLAVAYASSDVFLFPSAVETFGNVTLEAAASGLPVVVEAGCSGHLVKEGVNGFACPANDNDAFFHGTMELLVNERLRKSCSDASRAMSLGMEKSAVVRQMLTNYDRVTDQFYVEYGGHHSNRDKVYDKPHSFISGNHPRPFFILLSEWMVIILFTTIGYMTNFFVMMQDFMHSMAGQTISRRHQFSQVPVEMQHPRMTNNPIPSTIGGPSYDLHNAMDRPAPSTTSSAVVKSKVVQRGDSATIPDQSQTDDELSDAESRRSAISSSGHSWPGRTISHAIAHGLCSVIEFQCKWESNLRHFLASCARPVRQQGKRKDSRDVRNKRELVAMSTPLRKRMENNVDCRL